ncbi:hypothetical protein FKM82_021294, partial [Ascaphus truei]
VFKQKWVPLPLEDFKTEDQERLCSRNGTRSQSETKRSQNNKRGDYTRRPDFQTTLSQCHLCEGWRRDRDDLDEVSSTTREGGNVGGSFRGRGRGRGRARGRGKPHIHYEYSHGFREYSERTASHQPEVNTSMMYYYEDGSGVQMYPVDETLLKEYIKRQMP